MSLAAGVAPLADLADLADLAGVAAGSTFVASSSARASASREDEVGTCAATARSGLEVAIGWFVPPNLFVFFFLLCVGSLLIFFLGAR